MSSEGDPIRDDISSQVSYFVDLVVRTLDPSRYPRPADHVVFDQALDRLVDEFDRLQRLFQDYQLAVWSREISLELTKVQKNES